MPAYLYDIIRARMPDGAKTFIENHDGRLITYAGLDAGSAQLANVLVNLGVEPGDRVAVQVEKSPEAILLYLACVRAGAVFLPLNTAYTPNEIAYFLGDAEPRVFICDPAFKDKLASVAAGACLVMSVSSLAPTACSMSTSAAVWRWMERNRRTGSSSSVPSGTRIRLRP